MIDYGEDDPRSQIQMYDQRHAHYNGEFRMPGLDSRQSGFTLCKWRHSFIPGSLVCAKDVKTKVLQGLSVDDESRERGLWTGRQEGNRGIGVTKQVQARGMLSPRLGDCEPDLRAWGLLPTLEEVSKG